MGSENLGDLKVIGFECVGSKEINHSFVGKKIEVSSSGHHRFSSLEEASLRLPKLFSSGQILEVEFSILDYLNRGTGYGKLFAKLLSIPSNNDESIARHKLLGKQEELSKKQDELLQIENELIDLEQQMQFYISRGRK